MSNFEKPIIVFGVGSIGERHLKNLWNLGYKNLIVFRQRNLSFRDLRGVEVKTVTTWNEIIKIKPFVAIICSPTSEHLKQTLLCVKLGIHCLVEKPLSHNLENISLLYKALDNNNVFIYVGYMMRFHPLIAKIKKIIISKKYGNLLYLNSKWGEYLPDWHPWEDYRKSYAARKDLGGGVALTLSHDIDLSNYLINSPVDEFTIYKSYKSNLEIEVESSADILVKHKNFTVANIHLNFFEKSKERFLKLIFDEASLSIDFYKSSLTIKTPKDKEEIIILESFDRNDLFLEQSRFFFSKIDSYNKEDSFINIKESVQIIKMCNEEL